MMKTYVITLSKKFMKPHSKCGEPTFFKEKFLNGEKIHTIRKNHALWEKRIAEVKAGNACLSIRQWTDKPYRSKQVELARLTKENGVGIQIINIVNSSNLFIGETLYESVDEFALHDGLKPEDFIEWFDLDNLPHLFEDYAIIHFTNFRY